MQGPKQNRGNLQGDDFTQTHLWRGCLLFLWDKQLHAEHYFWFVGVSIKRRVLYSAEGASEYQ